MAEMVFALSERDLCPPAPALSIVPGGCVVCVLWAVMFVYCM